VPERTAAIVRAGTLGRGFDRAYEGADTERSREMSTFRPVNFARIAEGTGAIGIRVEKPAQLATGGADRGVDPRASPGGALRRALAADRPVPVGVHTDIDVIAPLVVS
jgi:acetolactate synthase I/II/III large subunit